MHHLDPMSPVGDHECEQVDGGNIESLVSIGIEVVVDVMMCAALNLLGVPCG
jgi:hypothetical protein